MGAVQETEDLKMWVTFKDKSGGYVEAKSHEEAMRIAKEKTGKEPERSDYLPYPANPIIHQLDSCPPFCYSPWQCKGFSACPKDYACSE